MIDGSRPKISSRGPPFHTRLWSASARQCIARASSCVERRSVRRTTFRSTTQRTSGRIERTHGRSLARSRGPRSVPSLNQTTHSRSKRRVRVVGLVEHRSLDLCVDRSLRFRRKITCVCARARYRVLARTTSTSTLFGKREGRVVWNSVLKSSPRRLASHGERRGQRWKRRWEERRDGRKRECG